MQTSKASTFNLYSDGRGYLTHARTRHDAEDEAIRRANRYGRAVRVTLDGRVVQRVHPDREAEPLAADEDGRD